MVLALILVLPGCVTLTLGLLPGLHERSWLVVHAAAFIHFGLIFWVLAGLALLIGLLVSRRIAPVVFGIPVVIGLAMQGSWWWPATHEAPEATSPNLTVAMVNMEMGQGDAETVAELDPSGRDGSVDVFVIVEATEGLMDRLDEAGLAESHPYSVGTGDPRATGTVIRSAYPLTEVERADTELMSLVAEVQTPMGQVLVAGVHPLNPIGGVSHWREDAQALRTTLNKYADEPMVAIGDYNAINQHSTMIHLEQDGFSNCADLTRQPSPRTWPADSDRIPAMIGIDHALVTPAMTCTGLRAFDVPGTDHRGIIAQVALTDAA